MELSVWLQRAKDGSRDVARRMYCLDFGFTREIHQHLFQRTFIVLGGKERCWLQARHSV